MAINVNIYSNANSSSRSVSFDFMGDVLATNDATGDWTADNDYYFKITTGGRQDDNSSIPVKVVRALDDLALNGQRQSYNNTTSAYGDIRAMVVDYTYDAINGHTQDQYGSGVAEQRPMKF